MNAHTGPESPPTGPGPLLTVRGLGAATRHRTLVDGVDLTMARGERVGLIGESGSGKSITALTLMGLLPDNVSPRGSVRLAGVDADLVTADDETLRSVRGRHMTMVFQEPLTSLNPLMRVGDQVAEVMEIHRTVPGRAQARARAVELLDQVHLPDPAEAARAYPHQLSGGQRQRVVLAIALANRPALLLADEPTTALDVTVQRQVLDLMLSSVDQLGTGLLFITHDLAVVANVCDRVLVMNEGRVVEEGTTEEVFTRPRHPYTRGLLAASDLDVTDQRGRLFTIASAAAYVPPSVPDDDAPAAAAGAEPALVAGAEPVAASRPAGAVAVGQDGVGPTEPAVVRGSDPAGLPDETALIRVRDLVRSYRRGRGLLRGHTEVHALRGVSFDVAAGRRFGVVGESGSGKSTLLRILAGLDQPTSGSVRVAGDEVAGARERDLKVLRRTLQIVFQDPMSSLDPRMSVEQIVTEPLENLRLSRRDSMARVRRILDDVGLPADAVGRYPHEFSGGERQRISIARALVGRPRVLLADEPVSALDVSVRAQVLNLLADLVDEYRLTLVFVSHDLGVVRHICDSVVVMREGEVVETGPVDDVYDRPRHEYTRTLVGSSMSLRSELAARSAAVS